MAGVKAGAFTCVGWQVTLYDPIWQETLCRSAIGFLLRLTFTAVQQVYQAAAAAAAGDNVVVTQYTYVWLNGLVVSALGIRAR